MLPVGVWFSAYGTYEHSICVRSIYYHVMSQTFMIHCSSVRNEETSLFFFFFLRVAIIPTDPSSCVLAVKERHTGTINGTVPPHNLPTPSTAPEDKNNNDNNDNKKPNTLFRELNNYKHELIYLRALSQARRDYKIKQQTTTTRELTIQRSKDATRTQQCQQLCFRLHVTIFSTKQSKTTKTSQRYGDK